MSPNSTGLIFDIERYATQDGPGIRTVVFFKGCPLRCQWCANPESQAKKPQLMFYQNRCRGCGRCLAGCPQKAIRLDPEFGLAIDTDKCTACGKCVESCYYDARKLMGTSITVDEVMEVVLRDSMFYKESGGGVTLSGGEPLLQPEFARALLERCKEHGLHTAIETCGCTTWENIESVLPYLDLVFFDIKHSNPVSHRKFTGVSNDKIIFNLQRLAGTFKPIIVRIPLIPGCNDSPAEQRNIYELVGKLPNVQRIEILPYHRLGMTKYQGLERKYQLAGVKPVEKSSLTYLTELGREYGVTVQIGSQKTSERGD